MIIKSGLLDKSKHSLSEVKPLCQSTAALLSLKYCMNGWRESINVTGGSDPYRKYLTGIHLYSITTLRVSGYFHVIPVNTYTPLNTEDISTRGNPSSPDQSNATAEVT